MGDGISRSKQRLCATAATDSCILTLYQRSVVALHCLPTDAHARTRLSVHYTSAFTLCCQL